MDLFRPMDRKRLTWLIIIFLMSSPTLRVKAQELAPAPKAKKILVIGFVGAMRSPKDKNQGVVQIGNRLKSSECSDLQVNIFSHWNWNKAFYWICPAMDRDQDGHLSDKELEGETKIVVYGHSMGAGAAMKLARKLEKANIQVELAVQIDSVGIGDDVVPGNVKSAANFYQSTGWLLGVEKKVRAQDESKTNILGNTLVNHVGHQALARDPQISDFITGKVLSLCGHGPAIVASECAQRVCQ